MLTAALGRPLPRPHSTAQHPLPPPACLLAPTADEVCKSQESSLALLWTLGIFTLNCGPVLMGFVLDFLGPKLTGILGGLTAVVCVCGVCMWLSMTQGCTRGQKQVRQGFHTSAPQPASKTHASTALDAPSPIPSHPPLPPCPLSAAGVALNMLALVLFGVSSSSGFNAFIPAAILLGLGNITFHLAQFHISALFPRSRGLVASVFVAGFTGCGIVMYLLSLIFESAGSTRWAGVVRRAAGRLGGWAAGWEGGRQRQQCLLQSTNCAVQCSCAEWAQTPHTRRGCPASPPADAHCLHCGCAPCAVPAVLCRAAYRTIMLSYAGVCSLWIPLLAWMMPSHSFRVGMVYLKRADWTFEVRLRSGAAAVAAAAVGCCGCMRVLACRSLCVPVAAWHGLAQAGLEVQPLSTAVHRCPRVQSLRGCTGGQPACRISWQPRPRSAPTATPGQQQPWRQRARVWMAAQRGQPPGMASCRIRQRECPAAPGGWAGRWVGLTGCAAVRSQRCRHSSLLMPVGCAAAAAANGNCCKRQLPQWHAVCF